MNPPIPGDNPDAKVTLHDKDTGKLWLRQKDGSWKEIKPMKPGRDRIFVYCQYCGKISEINHKCKSFEGLE
jgi:hypothetical protein